MHNCTLYLSILNLKLTKLFFISLKLNIINKGNISYILNIPFRITKTRANF